MKKPIIILLSLVAVSLFIFNFLNKDTKTTQKILTENKNIIKLKFGHNTPTTSALHEASVKFANEVERKSDGKIKVKIYPAQQLGNDHKMVELARKGEIDILLTPTAKMSVPLPAMQYADLPFLFPSREDAYNMLDGEPGKILLNNLKKIDLVGVTFWENGFKHFTSNALIKEPKDFIDKKIRVMKSRIIMEQFKSLNAEPIPIDFHSTKKALANKVVDGQENPLIAIVSMGFHEVQSYLTLSEHAYLGYVFSISSKIISKLPIDIRKILIETAKEITPWERKRTQEKEQELLATIKAAGVKIHTLTKEEKLKFAQATKHIINQYESTIGVDIISKTQELLAKKYKDENSVVLGIDADISMGAKKAGLSIKRGVQLAVDEINNNGGLLGKKIIIIAKDHKAMAEKGKQNIKEFVNDIKAIAIVGGKHSAVISNELEVIKNSSIPYMIPWAAAAKLTDIDYSGHSLFRVSINDAYATKFLSNQIIDKYKNPAIIVENSIWGRGALKKVKKHFLKSGLNPPKEIIINRGQKDFKQNIQTLKENNIDSVIIVLNSKEGTAIVKTMGEEKLYIPIVSHWGIVGGNFFKTNKEHLKNIDLRFIQTFSFYNNNKIATKFGEKYIKKYGLESTNNIVAPAAVAQAYDAVKLLALGIKKANSFDYEKVTKAIENLPNYNGVLKNYTPAFSATDHDALGEEDFFMAKFNENGFIVPIKR